MVIVARLIIGLGAGYGALVVHSYLGEMSTRLDEIRQKEKKKPIKHIFYISFLFLMNGAFVLSFGKYTLIQILLPYSTKFSRCIIFVIFMDCPGTTKIRPAKHFQYIYNLLYKPLIRKNYFHIIFV